MQHYTRSKRLQDHRIVIRHLKENPPQGWNGKLIFLGVSEGGPIVTTLTTDYPEMAIATINWSGAGDFSWEEELWSFIENSILITPWYIKLCAKLPTWVPFSMEGYFPSSRQAHSKTMEETIKNPAPDRKLAGRTYKYHADALRDYPKPQYEKIKTPFLVVMGEQDPIIKSADEFVRKAKEAGASITYMRTQAMDHYVRKREDVIADSFNWLRRYLY